MADKAILFGINEYKSIAPLYGCLNDIDNVERLLTESFGFDPKNVRSYCNDEVIESVVRENFEWLADGAAEGDRLVFHFSGHGSYTTSESNDKDIDELICLYDMDWENEESFIRDTDLGELTRSVERGRLTVILDSCHSGDGTRGLTRSFKAARRILSSTNLIIVKDTARQIAKQKGAAAEHESGLLSASAKTFNLLGREATRTTTPPVYARFVEPPASVHVAAERRRSMRVRRLGEAMVTQDLNHQLLAAAHETQTAADAFIDGEYNGAFSYYLCDQARELGRRASYESVMDAVIDTIRNEGYSQVPQNEGPFESEALFGGAAAETTIETGTEFVPGPLVEDSSMDGDFDDKEPTSLGTENISPLETLNHLLRVSEKLVDLAGASSQAAIAGVEPRGVSDEVVVYVHGISRHVPNYSAAWYAAMSPYLAHRIPRREVLWSWHVNRRLAERGEAALEELTQLQREIEAELNERTEHLEQQAQTRTPDARSRSAVRMERPRGSRLAVDDFTRYMLFRSTREAILGEFFQVVTPLLQQGKNVHIISHSWGTVVSYEGMRRLDSQSFPGRVRNLFVVGSALSIGAVQSNLFERVHDGRLPRHVDRVINLDAGGDVVGGRIGDEFDVDREFLGLEPTGCTTIPFTGIAINPACAHSSYFRRANRSVNRSIFANTISRT